MDPENDPGVARLLHRALPDDAQDPHGLVAAAMTRGRAQRRRHQAGTALAALAVFGVIGAVAAVVPLVNDAGGGGPTPVATDPTTSSEPSASEPPAPQHPVAITIAARDVPAAVEEIVGRREAGALRTGATGPRDTADEVVAHFGWQGTLTSVIVEKVAPNAQRQCGSGADATGGACDTNAAGDVRLTWGPTLGDGVTAQGVSTWHGTFEVSVLSYNAAEGKDVATLMADPPLTLEELAAVADSTVWFE